CQRNVVEVSRAIQGDARITGLERTVEPAAETFEGSERTGQANPRSPHARRYPLGRFRWEETGLCGQAAVQVEDAQFPHGVSPSDPECAARPAQEIPDDPHVGK